MLEKIFSIKNIKRKNGCGTVKKYKQLTFLGIKFSFGTGTEIIENENYKRLFSATSTNAIYLLDDSGRRIKATSWEQIKKLGEFIIKGENNTIIIPNSDNLKCKIEIEGNNNHFELAGVERPSYIWCAFEKPNNNRCVKIGKAKLIGNVHIRLIDSDKSITIGNDCLFSYGIYIWTCDSHEIYDINSHQRINNDKDVVIGDNVWIGRNVSLHKGCVIPQGCIVGANAFVNKKFEEENCILAGTPAKIVKTGIYWKY